MQFQLSDLFNTTVSQAIAWILTSGILASLVGYALGWVPEKYAKIKSIANTVLVAMLTAGAVALASFVPDSFGALKLIDALVVIFGALAASFGGVKIGAVKAESHRAEQLKARSLIKTLSDTAKSFIIFMALAGIVASLLIAPVASAAGPDDFLPQMVKCSSLPVSVLRVLQQSFDTQYGYDHALTNVFQWQATYEARVNQFAVLFGCPPPLANGALTFWYRVYDPIYDVPTVSGLAR